MATKLKAPVKAEYTGQERGLRMLMAAVIEQALYDYAKAVKENDEVEKYSIRRFFSERVQHFSELDSPNEFYLGVLDKIDSGEITTFNSKKRSA